MGVSKTKKTVSAYPAAALPAPGAVFMQSPARAALPCQWHRSRTGAFTHA